MNRLSTFVLLIALAMLAVFLTHAMTALEQIASATTTMAERSTCIAPAPILATPPSTRKAK